MADEGKKISFGFTKSIRKSVLVKQVPQEEKTVDYIECLDEKAIKVIGKEEKEEESLVIPLLGSKTWHDRIVNKIDADIFEPKPSDKNDTQNVTIKKEPQEASNGYVASIDDGVSSIQIKKEPPDENEGQNLTLEEQAAKEIMEDVKSEKKESDLTLPLAEEQNLRGVEESTLEDYEKIPVDAFGFAMLRGMGWKPGKGIGKNEKVVVPIEPELRPRILGASKMALQKPNGKVEQEEKELRMDKGSYIKIIAGKRSNTYGQIEGFDQQAGRVIVKMALTGDTISVDESLVQTVTTAEYSKNSKVLNATKYEEFRNKESAARRSASPESGGNVAAPDVAAPDEKRKPTKDERHRSRKSSKKSKAHRKDSAGSDGDSDSKRKHRKRKYSSGSDSGGRKAKKSKKHKNKDREREGRKDRPSKYSESHSRRKSTKYRRSRSRSSGRR